MSRTWWPHENRTLGDLRACLYWFRSKRGPLYRDWQMGRFEGIDTFRALLRVLDGPENGLRALADDGPVVASEVRIYRRIRRAVQREIDAIATPEED